MGDPNLEAGSNLKRWREHPAAYVEERFGVKPDPAQAEALEAFPHQPRIAMQACTGAGKTSTLAWIGWNFLLTRPNPMIGATSISGPNLQANLWTEMARWRKVDPMLDNLFEQTSKSITNRQSPDTWKMEARTWDRSADANNMGNSLRGIHAEYVMWLMDETGGYPDALLPTCEAIFSGSPKEAHIVQAGNPIKRSGPLWKAASSGRRSWYVIEITADPDAPNRTPRVSVEHARQQIEDWGGRDNPFVMVNILGKFPLSDFNALISPDEVQEAMKRYYRPDAYQNMPRVMGVDVAREGDDASAIFCRQGIQSFPIIKLRGVTSIPGAGRVARKWEDWDADACFIDMGGGFGAGWYDQLVAVGRAPIGIDFGGAAHLNSRYANKRTEMYFDACEWIKRGGALPPSPEITAALTQTNYTFEKVGSRMILEPKLLVKKKIGYSPDEADAFVLTFAEPVTKAARTGPQRMAVDYDPFREAHAGFNLKSAIDSSYDPMKG